MVCNGEQNSKKSKLNSRMKIEAPGTIVTD